MAGASRVQFIRIEDEAHEEHLLTSLREALQSDNMEGRVGAVQVLLRRAAGAKDAGRAVADAARGGAPAARRAEPARLVGAAARAVGGAPRERAVGRGRRGGSEGGVQRAARRGGGGGAR